MEFFSPEYWSEWPFPSPGDLPNPGIESRSLALQADSLPAEPQGKPKNTGVSSLSFVQWICLTQGSSCGLLHCRQILYQLSWQRSPPVGMVIIQKRRNKSVGEDVGKKCNTVRCWCECKLVQPLRTYVWKFPKKCKVELPFDPGIIYSPLCLAKEKENTHSQRYLQSHAPCNIIYNSQDMEVN